MKISIIGTGYVGLVSGVCFSQFGFDVTCVDIDEAKIKNLNNGIAGIYEPGIEDLLVQNISSERLTFTADMESAVTQSEVIFICVGTPSKEDGSADLRHVLNVAKKIAVYMNGYKVIVNKSTVPVGTAKMVKEIMHGELLKRSVSYDFDVVSNPEFLREGAAITDFMHPDRIVVGTETVKALEIMKELYRALFLNNHPFVFTNLETAEMIKYASNSFLATKITFINELAILCEKIGANVQEVASAMGLDKRIGKLFLHAGPGYGGSCFPKDTLALKKIAKDRGVNLKILEATIVANEYQREFIVDKIVSRLDGVAGKKIAILGLSFKAETDDIRESAAIKIVEKLYEKKADIRVYDPQAMENAKLNEFANMEIQYAADEYSVASGVDAIIIATEWNQFRSLDLIKMKAKMKGNYFFDLRNVYPKAIVEKEGFIYEGIGV